MFFQETFFEKVFLFLSGKEQKHLVFCRRFSGGVVKLDSTCPQELFEELYIFRERVVFFLSFSNNESFFGRSSIFFDGLVITACYVSKHISKKKIFFEEKIFLSLSEIEREFFWRSEKKFRQGFTTAICMFERMGKMSQMQSTRSWEQFDAIFFWKNSCFSTFFGHLEIIFRFFFAKNFSKPLSELLYNCPEEHSQEIVSREKSVFPLVTMSINLLALCRRVF